MIGSQEAVDRTSGQVIFTFSHVLSRIKVKIINGTGFDTDPINGMYVELTNTLTSAQVNMVTRVVTPVSSETVKAIRLKQKDSNQEFSGAFIPQSVAKDKKLLMIYDSEGRLAASLTLGETKTFVSGKDYSIEVTLKKSGLGFSADITDWAAEDWGQADANQDWEYAN